MRQRREFGRYDMGLFGTIVAFGIGYAAGAATGRKSVEHLPAQVRQALPGRLGESAEVEDDTPASTIDVREIRQIMSAAPEAVRKGDSLQEAARLMKADDIGDVLVEEDDGRLAGIITDRDIAIRATAEGSDPTSTLVEGVFTRDIAALAPTDTVQRAIEEMRASDVRRLPVVEGGRAIGVVSLGDISIETSPDSALADISIASPDR